MLSDNNTKYYIHNKIDNTNTQDISLVFKSFLPVDVYKAFLKNNNGKWYYDKQYFTRELLFYYTLSIEFDWWPEKPNAWTITGKVSAQNQFLQDMAVAYYKKTPQEQEQFWINFPEDLYISELDTITLIYCASVKHELCDKIIATLLSTQNSIDQISKINQEIIQFRNLKLNNINFLFQTDTEKTTRKNRLKYLKSMIHTHEEQIQINQDIVELHYEHIQRLFNYELTTIYNKKLKALPTRINNRAKVEHACAICLDFIVGNWVLNSIWRRTLHKVYTIFVIWPILAILFFCLLYLFSNVIFILIELVSYYYPELEINYRRLRNPFEAYLLVSLVVFVILDLIKWLLITFYIFCITNKVFIIAFLLVQVKIIIKVFSFYIFKMTIWLKTLSEFFIIKSVLKPIGLWLLELPSLFIKLIFNVLNILYLIGQSFYTYFNAQLLILNKIMFNYSFIGYIYFQLIRILSSIIIWGFSLCITLLKTYIILPFWVSTYYYHNLIWDLFFGCCLLTIDVGLLLYWLLVQFILLVGIILFLIKIIFICYIISLIVYNIIYHFIKKNKQNSLLN